MKWVLALWMAAGVFVRGNDLGEGEIACGTRADATGGNRGFVAQSPSPTWTIGTKRVLVMRLEFVDLPLDTATEARCQEMMTYCDRVFWTNSYGKLNLTWAITSVLRMPGVSTDYTNFAHLQEEGWKAAIAAGYRKEDSDLDIMIGHAQLGEGTISFVGQANLGARGAYVLVGTHFAVAIHELGHNFGLRHANAWIGASDAVSGAGVHREYGGPV